MISTLTQRVLLEYAQNYYNAYWFFVCVSVLLTVLAVNKKSPVFNKSIVFLFIVGVSLFIAFRPITYFLFGDSPNYARDFIESRYRDFEPLSKDLGYEISLFLLNAYPLWVFFLAYGIIYTGAQYFAVKQIFPKYVGLGMILILTSFSFYGYAFNGMRNGAACALVMLGIVQPGLIWKAAIFVVAASIHKSVLLPEIAYIAAYFYTDTRKYVYCWLLCLIVNAAIPNLLGDVTWLSDNFEDDRVGYLTSDFDTMDGAGIVKFSHTGFRWDFALYSALPIFLGWWTIIKEKIKNSEYALILNIYLICNAAWLFTTRIPYSNRFAYLSWFLYPLLLLYPFLLNPKLRSNTSINLLILANLIFCFII